MGDELQAALGLPPVNQLGYVVRDLEQAIRLYEPVFGNFETLDAFDLEWEYRGRPETSSIKVAVAKSGDVEIELMAYNLRQDFGIDPNGLRQRFMFYFRQFPVQPERPFS